MVQRVSHGLNGSEDLCHRLTGDKEISKYLGAQELEEIFSGQAHKKAISKIVRRVGV